MAKPVLSYYKIGIIYAVWWITWAAIQAYLIRQLGYAWSTALVDASISQGVLALAGYSLNTSLHSYQPGQRNAIYALLVTIVLAILSVLVQRWLILQALSGVEGYSDFIANTWLLREGYAWLVFQFIAILTWFWVYVNDKQASEQRKEDAERLARNAELANLRMQLQPHFLFNSLNSISALVVTQPEKARAMIHQLSDFLRGTVRREDKTWITLGEELQLLQLYLDIEKVRFGHRLRTELTREEPALSAQLPPLLLQPLVENAIKFGLYDTIGEITISISAKLENRQLIIEVRNPYDPATSQPPRGTGFGLDSIRRRLYLLYFQNDLLEARQEGMSFITTMKIPQTA